MDLGSSQIQIAYEPPSQIARRFLQNPVEAHEKLLRVEHRDIPGVIAPLKASFGQRSLIECKQRALALNLKIQIDAVKSGQKSYITNLAERVAAQKPVYQHEIGLQLLIGKSRRIGASTETEGTAFERMVLIPGFAAVVMAHQKDSAEEIFNLMKTFDNHWPEEFDSLKPKNTSNARDRIALENGSRCLVRTAGPEGGKREVGRGGRTIYYHFSEYAHYKSYGEVAAMLSGSQPFAWVIKESTANGRQGPFYSEWQNALYVHEAEEAYNNKDAEVLASWNGVYKFFVPWLDDPELTMPVFDWEKEHLEETLDDDERALLDTYPTKCDLGRIKWRRHYIDTRCQDHHTLDPVAFFRQEFPANDVEMFQSTSTSVFDQDALAALSMRSVTEKPKLVKFSHIEPSKKGRSKSSNLLVYQKPQKGARYVIGADVGYGIGKDYSVAVVFDRKDGTILEEAACYRSNTINPKDFGDVLTMLAEWYNNAYLCPEIVGPGIATCNRIIDNRYPYIYRRKTLDKIGPQPGDRLFRVGFLTTENSKAQLVGDTQPMLQFMQLGLRTQVGIDEFKIFQLLDARGRMPKYGAPEDGKSHDDYVMAAMLGVFMHIRGGIPNVLSQDDPNKPESSWNPEDRAIMEAIAAKIQRSMQENIRMPGVRQSMIPDD